MAPPPQRVPPLALALLLGLAVTVCGRQADPAKPAAAAQGGAAAADAGNAGLFVDDQYRMAVTAATIVGTGASLTGELPVVIGLLNPQHSTVWPVKEEPVKPQLVRDQAPLLLPDVLARVQDGRGIPHGWDDAKGKAAAERATDEHFAFNYVLYEAFRTTQEAFARSARRDLTYAHLFNEPRKHRGEVVHLEGRLKRLVRYDAPVDAARVGVRDLYEGWVFNEIYGANPTCVLVTEIPKEIKPGLQVEYRVAFDGYFFKKYRYKAADSLKPNEARDAPLLIGHTLVLTETALGADVDNAEVAQAKWVLPSILIGSIGGAFVLIFGLTWWYRKADRQVRARLDESRVVGFIEPGEPASPPLAWPVGRVEQPPPNEG